MSTGTYKRRPLDDGERAGPIHWLVAAALSPGRLAHGGKILRIAIQIIMTL
jgi:hypothetical protein